MKRTFTLLGLTLSLVSTVAQTESANLRFFDDPVMQGVCFKSISSNGRYVLGENQYTYTLYLLDRLSGDIRVISPPQSGESNLMTSGFSVSDDGTIAGIYSDPGILVMDLPVTRGAWYKEGTWNYLEALPNTIWNGYGFDGGALIISPDGELIGGCLSSDKQPFFFEPVLWKNNEIYKRLSLPEEAGSGGQCLALSADGRVAGGWVRDARYGSAAIWMDDELITLGDLGRVTNITDNGRFAIGFYQDESTYDRYLGDVPFVWTEESGFSELPVPAGTDGAEVYAITEEGDVIIGYSQTGFYGERAPMIIRNGIPHDLDNYLHQNYAISPDHSLYTPVDITKNGDAMCGFTIVDGFFTPWLLEFSNYTDGIQTPESYRITISLDDENSLLKVAGEYAALEIYNHSGVLCHRENAGGGCVVDMSGFPAGVYLIRTIYNGKIKVMKVIKSR